MYSSLPQILYVQKQQYLSRIFVIVKAQILTVFQKYKFVLKLLVNFSRNKKGMNKEVQSLKILSQIIIFFTT